jgi:hypothetical protein
MDSPITATSNTPKNINDLSEKNMTESQSQNFVTESDSVMEGNIIRGTRKIAHSENIDLSQVSSESEAVKRNEFGLTTENNDSENSDIVESILENEALTSIRESSIESNSNDNVKDHNELLNALEEMDGGAKKNKKKSEKSKKEESISEFDASEETIDSPVMKKGNYNNISQPKNPYLSTHQEQAILDRLPSNFQGRLPDEMQDNLPNLNEKMGMPGMPMGMPGMPMGMPGMPMGMQGMPMGMPGMPMQGMQQGMPAAPEMNNAQYDIGAMTAMGMGGVPGMPNMQAQQGIPGLNMTGGASKDAVQNKQDSFFC